MPVREWQPDEVSIARDPQCESIPFDQIDFQDPIFDSIKLDYPEHDEWRKRAILTSNLRSAFVVRSSSTPGYSGIAILKGQEGPDGPLLTGLKISTFKVAPGARSQGIADVLLSKVFEKAIESGYDLVFVTVKLRHEDLARYLELRGFRRAPNDSVDGEHVYIAELDHPERIYSHINRLAYDILAGEYRARSESPGPNQESPEYLAGLLVSRLRKPIRRILELGPGSGSVLACLARDASETIAVEISSKMAALSAQHAPHALTIVADILDIDFPDQSFDGIYAGAFLHLFPEAKACSILQKMAAWTKSDGAVFMNTSVSEQSSQSIELKADYLHRVARFRSRWTEDQFRVLIESNGFRILDRVTTDEQERSKFWVAYICAPRSNGGG